MANKTDPLAASVHGTNPQFLVEKILRQKIYDDNYWKEHLFGLTAETIVDRAMELDHIGGTFGGNNKPTVFIQLVLKLLQLQPEKEIVLEFIRNEEFKYVRALGAFYLRLTGRALDIYQYLEPLLNDYRKLRVISGGERASHQKRDLKYPERMAWAGYSIMYMDVFIDQLLRDPMVLDVALPTLPKRLNLEDLKLVLPRISALDDDILSEEEEAEPANPTGIYVNSQQGNQPTESSESGRTKQPSPPRREPERETDRDRGRDRDRDKDRGRDRSRSRSRDRYRRERSRERSSSRGRRGDAGRRRRSTSRERRRSRSPRRRSPSRSRSRDRSRERRRYRSRSRSRDRRSRSRSESRGRRKEEEEGGDKKQPAQKKKVKKIKEKGTEVDTEIDEANKLRAALGLKPLKNVDEWKSKH
uniref:Pre-mRNA-splicing factor 38 n=1 Tax=Guillardia theta TaxID=55529 RepID=A0A7S4HBY5_GUITH|mmetsp:Transcript_1338/g.4097  ORF Transcript_1338/g.4097 Transcript_1338/m.4097 type:complete len:415 (+) Transcript_1338:112-1356(+)